MRAPRRTPTRSGSLRASYRVEGLHHWPDHLESSAILEQANFRARGGDFGTIDQRFAAFRRCRSKGPRHVPLAALGPSQCRWRKILCSPGCRKSKDQTGRVDPFKHQYALTFLLEGDAGLALNFRGNEHVPPSSHTDLWPDNCTDSRLLGLNLSAAGPNPTRYNREISECGRGA